MSENTIIYIVSPILTAVIGGVTYLVKRALSNLEEKVKLEKEDRLLRRAEIDLKITDAEEKIDKALTLFKRVASLVITCEHPNCPTKQKLVQLLKEDNI